MEFAFKDSELFSFKYGNEYIPFSKVTFDNLLKRAAEQVCFSRVKAYSFRRGAHTNAYMADQDNLVECAPRTLKTIGDHALTYHENYVSIDLKDLAEKFASIKKLRIEAMLDSLPLLVRANLQLRFSSINLRRAANAIISTIPVCFPCRYFLDTIHRPHCYRRRRLANPCLLPSTLHGGSTLRTCTPSTAHPKRLLQHYHTFSPANFLAYTRIHF